MAAPRFRTLRRRADGSLPWPPKPLTGGPVHQATLDQYAAVAWTLARLGGDVENTSGLISADLLAAVPNPSLFHGVSTNLSARLNELRELGLVEVERRGRRTFRAALMVETHELPMPDPCPAPEPEAVDTPQTTSAPPPILGAAAPPEPTPVEAMLANLFGDTNAAHLVAVALLDEVLDRYAGKSGPEAPVRAQRDHLARELADTKRELRRAHAEVETLTGRLKSRTVERDEERRLREGAEANIATVLGAVREYQARANGSLGEENRKLLERMMRTVPGFDRADDPRPR
jgi:hypothetical protein